MLSIHEIATITSKGQITLPKAIRQALGVEAGDKVGFELRENGEVLVHRAAAEHEDPAIGAFLSLLERDIQSGQHVRDLPDELARSFVEHAGHPAAMDEDFDGDVVL